MSPTERFERIYLGDEHIRQISLNIAEETCQMELSGAALLRIPQKLFDYEIRYEPATLMLTGVLKVNYPEWYCLNHLIVEYDSTPAQQEGYYKFSFTMTGGWDNDTFMRTVEIVAKDFSLSGTPVALPPVDA